MTTLKNPRANISPIRKWADYWLRSGVYSNSHDKSIRGVEEILYYNLAKDKIYYQIVVLEV